MLEVGTRVTVTERAATKYRGATGTVVGTPTNITPQYKVKMDHPARYGWSDGTGHAYFMRHELEAS